MESLRTAVLNGLLSQIKCAASLMLDYPECPFFRERLKSLIAEHDAALDMDIFAIHVKYFTGVSTLQKELE